jgi:hypothetical protein
MFILLKNRHIEYKVLTINDRKVTELFYFKDVFYKELRVKKKDTIY